MLKADRTEIESHLAQKVSRWNNISGVCTCIVSDSGISANLGRVKAVRDFPVPSNLKQIRFLLGLASYYQRFFLR